MLKLTRQNFDKVKQILLRQQKKIQEDLKSVNDPVMNDGLAESSEPGTDSWMADVHNQAVAVKDNLQTMLAGVSKSLARLRSGNYGKCESCGKLIEPARLEAMPAATLCLSCSKKKTARRQ